MKAKIIGGLVVVLVVGFKFAAKFGLAFGLGTGIAMADIEASKSQPWPTEFKTSFVDGCTADAKPEERDFLVEYCKCATDKIEAAHVIPTKYNSNIETEAEMGDKIAKLVEEYFKTEVGQKSAKHCSDSAQETLAKRIPSDKPVKHEPASVSEVNAAGVSH